MCGKRTTRSKQIQSKMNILMNIIITNDVLLWDRDVDRKTKRIITHTKAYRPTLPHNHKKRIPINLVLVMVFIAVVVMTRPIEDSSCFINTGNAPKMTYNYTMSSVLVSIALQKVVIGKEIIGIDTIQINHITYIEWGYDLLFSLYVLVANLI